MIKAVATGAGGKPVLILGLSRMNTELLLDGKPISIDLMSYLGHAATLVLMAGETEEAITAELRPLCGPGTQFSGPDPWETAG
jgi:hypothetical protein